MPLMMPGQNVQSSHANLRAGGLIKINIQANFEIIGRLAGNYSIPLD